MGRIATITVGDDLAEFIAHKVNAGEYASEAEVVQAALELLRTHDDGLVAIRAAIDEGEASGEPQPFDASQFLYEVHRKHGA
jgi:antitoxin ParD1/3/4